MAVNEKTQTAEEKDAANKSQKQREADMAQKIIGSLDLPVGLADAVDKKSKEDEGREEEDETSEEEHGQEEDGQEETDDEAESDEGEDDSEASEEVEEEDEPLSPEGKKAAQKRIDELIKRNKRQEAELKRLKEGKEQVAKTEEEETGDADLKTLNRLASLPNALEKLNALKDDVMLAFKKETDPAKEKALLDLSKKIDKTIADVPNRFHRTQLANYQAAMRETAEAYGETFTEKVAEGIYAIAKTIFSKSTTLQASPTGQAEAWRLATERYEDQKKFSAGKSRNEDNLRQITKLKKKVSLDVAVNKGNTDKSENKKLFNKAKTGNNSDKAAAIKKIFNTDSLIPDKYKQQR